MKQGFGLALAAMLGASVVAGPAGARTVFFDNFDSENGGVLPNRGIANYNRFINFDSVQVFTAFGLAGGVDILSNGFPNGGNLPPILCAGNRGQCVDLDGSPGPGRIRSKATFAFHKGDTIRLSVDLSGNQRKAFGSGADSFGLGFNFFRYLDVASAGTNFFGTDVLFPGAFQSFGVGSGFRIEPDAPFGRRALFFTAGEDGSFKFNISNGGADNVGPILDNVQLDITPRVPEPASWALMIAGFGLTGTAMRRRRGNVRVLA